MRTIRPISAAALAALAHTFASSAYAQCHTRVLAQFSVDSLNSFGSVITISRDGSTALIGEPGAAYTGEAYILNNSSGSWTLGPRLTQSLDPPLGVFPTNTLGDSVALSADGNTAIVGNSYHNHPTTTGFGQGIAYAFARVNGVWMQQGAALLPLEVTSTARFGAACAISADGNTALVGAPNDQTAGGGTAYVFVRFNGAWFEDGGPLPFDPTAFGKVGAAVALSADGNTAAVGAPFDGLGSVYVFTRPGAGAVWTQQGPKLIPTGAIGANFCGAYLNISDDGNTIIAGAEADSNNKGAAYIFSRTNNAWQQQARLLGSIHSGYFGGGVAISADGNTVLIGSSAESPTSGAAFLFSRSGAAWVRQGPSLVPPEGSSHNFGTALALSGDGRTALIGSGHSHAVASLYPPPIGMAQVFNLCSPTACPADFNGTGLLTIQDIFDFLNAWLAADPRADFNGVDGLTTQDVFDFLSAWLTGC
jgi:hypothetical protein